MNTLSTSISGRALSSGAIATFACLALAGCGQSQNWDKANAYVSLGGTVAGLNGTVTLENNGANPFPVSANGSFTFPLQVANASAYAVTVSSQPSGQSCAIAHASGTAVQNVTSIVVTCKAEISVGGLVSGLAPGASITLTNNGGNALTVNKNGPFTFTGQIADGSAYTVTISTQPTIQLCSVANGAGTASGNVSSIAVTCQTPITLGGTVAGLTGSLTVATSGANPVSITVKADGPYVLPGGLAAGSAYAAMITQQPTNLTCTLSHSTGTATSTVANLDVTCVPFMRRALPAIYTTGKPINYSPYRAAGPQFNEIPSNADILQDLSLLEAAGFNLLRLFASDEAHDAVVSLASANYPSLRFQIGIYLGPDTPTCSSATNLAQVQDAIVVANTYPNVATVSVGNETSFAGDVPVNCLVEYVQMVRGQVKQPVTADDDYTFYAGQTASGELPDTVLPVLDWVSIHTYPFSNIGSWNWQQVTPADPNGPAAGMMAAALANAQNSFQLVASHPFRDQSGATVTIGATLPITVGETGWKSTPTNFSSPLETVASPAIANPVNAKWYYDEMTSWQGSAHGPLMVFTFEAFDETWKGSDDGWGLWNSSRQARYALCGTSVGSPCTAPVYSGAGYFH